MADAEVVQAIAQLAHVAFDDERDAEAAVALRVRWIRHIDRHVPPDRVHRFLLDLRVPSRLRAAEQIVAL